MSDLTLEQQATNFETTKHIQLVQHNLHKIVNFLLERGENHDKSKLSTPEVEAFTEVTPRLASLVYGSEEYKNNLQEIQGALDHHYANNRHHPQFFQDGIDGMNLVDLVEMFCDWTAATKRNKDGDIRKSIEINKSRFNISPQLTSIFNNTVKLLED